MLNTIDVRAYRAAYERCAEAPEDHPAREIAESVDQAARDVMNAFRAAGYGADNSDHAESMVGALTWYFLASNPSLRGAIPPEPGQAVEAPKDEEREMCDECGADVTGDAGMMSASHKASCSLYEAAMTDDEAEDAAHWSHAAKTAPGS